MHGERDNMPEINRSVPILYVSGGASLTPRHHTPPQGSHTGSPTFLERAVARESRQRHDLSDLVSEQSAYSTLKNTPRGVSEVSIALSPLIGVSAFCHLKGIFHA